MSNKKIKIYENLVLVTQIGIMMVVPIMLSLFIGRWLDDKLKTENVFLFVFIVIGVIASFVNLYKIAMRGIKRK